MAKVLVTDGGHKNTLAIARALGRAGHEISVLSHLPWYSTMTAYSRYCRMVHKLPCDGTDAERFARDIASIITREHYDFLIPVGLKSCLAVSQYRDVLPAQTKIAIADWEAMQLAASKDRIAVLARRLGVPDPATRVLTTREDLDSVTAYPVVVKSSDGFKGFVRYCNDRTELEHNFEWFKSHTMANVIVQEYVRGFGCGFFGIYDHGKLVAHFMHKRIVEFPVTGGPSAVAESYFDDRLFNAGKTLCDALDWHGPIMAEFKYDQEHDRYELIEVNPKLWGSLDLAIEAGLDVPGILLEVASGRTPVCGGSYAKLRYRWLFPDEFKALMSSPGPGNILKFLKPSSSTRTNLVLSDPLPALFQIGRGLIDGALIAASPRRRFPHGRLRLPADRSVK